MPREKPKRILPESASLAARVVGRVQGVGFRYFTVRLAEDIGLSGYVMNCRDGSVEILVEGDREALERFLDRVRQGPAGARVERVEENWGPPTGRFAGFTVRFGG